MTPTVSFIVPCYKLAHFLSECVNSILCQTFTDFEVLIMDDCSPDDTPEVAASFLDPRVHHFRHTENLGHLRNYNRGIALSQGKYIWIISADDRLQSPEVLSRFVSVLETHSSVGYVFCSAIDIVEGKEVGVSDWAFTAPTDEIINGYTFLERLLKSNCIHAPSVLARRACYEFSQFPLDLPHSGDWYLWCRFALHFDVGYVAEPMVAYRRHDANMTAQYLGPKVFQCIADEIAVRWRIMRDAEVWGCRDIVRMCKEEIVKNYIQRILWKQEYNWMHGLTLEDFDKSLNINARHYREANYFRSRVYAGLGDHSYWRGDLRRARHFYQSYLHLASVPSCEYFLKYMLLWFGGFGSYMRFLMNRVRAILKSAEIGNR